MNDFNIGDLVRITGYEPYTFGKCVMGAIAIVDRIYDNDNVYILISPDGIKDETQKHYLRRSRPWRYNKKYLTKIKLVQKTKFIASQK